MKTKFTLLSLISLAICISCGAAVVDSTGVVLPGTGVIPWLEIGGILTAIYELLVRTIKTKVKFWSIIEIAYRIIQFLIPNRTTESVAKKERHLLNFWKKS